MSLSTSNGVLLSVKPLSTSHSVVPVDAPLDVPPSVPQSPARCPSKCPARCPSQCPPQCPSHCSYSMSLSILHIYINDGEFGKYENYDLVGHKLSCIRMLFFFVFFLKSILACRIIPMAKLWTKPLLGLKRGLILMPLRAR